MSQPDISVPLYIITGFLGSGKTTLLNRVLDEASARGMKVGVIINEWGQASVDSAIVGARDVEIEELNNGQVFCTCLIGDFIKALKLYAERELDAVVVETSGMANPLPLQRILDDVKKVTEGHYEYKGMTALIDPDSFLDLVGAIAAVDEQVIASQRIIINKVDLTSESDLEEVRSKVRVLNSKAQVMETSFAKIEGFFDTAPQPASARPLFGFGPMPKGGEMNQRPGDFLIKTGDRLEQEKVQAFFNAVLPKSLRVKGVFKGKDDVWYYADGVNAQVQIQPLGYEAEGTFIVVIPRPNVDLKSAVRRAWMQHCGVCFTLS